MKEFFFESESRMRSRKGARKTPFGTTIVLGEETGLKGSRIRFVERTWESCRGSLETCVGSGACQSRPREGAGK